MSWKSSRIQALVMMVIGSLLGYAAATADSSRSASAASLASDLGPTSLGVKGAGQSSCCSGELDQGTLLAMTERNEAVAANAAQAGKTPNILVSFGDDIGQANVSAYTMGLMGYRTPNIDRIAKEDMIFTDYDAEQSCTAGRSSFITGQCTFRTGLSKVGVPAATVGLQKGDPTIAELLKPLGYATGQFGRQGIQGPPRRVQPVAVLARRGREEPRRGFFYFNDDGDLVALRFENWKSVFLEQRAPGTFRVWAEPFTPLRVPKLFDLRADPYERADITSNTYDDWFISQPYIIFAAQGVTARFLDTFKEFPPRQRAASFSIDQAVEMLKKNIGNE